jgi:hypothetical protein
MVIRISDDAGENPDKSHYKETLRDGKKLVNDFRRTVRRDMAKKYSGIYDYPVSRLYRYILEHDNLGDRLLSTIRDEIIADCKKNNKPLPGFEESYGIFRTAIEEFDSTMNTQYYIRRRISAQESFEKAAKLGDSEKQEQYSKEIETLKRTGCYDRHSSGIYRNVYEEACSGNHIHDVIRESPLGSLPKENTLPKSGV